MEGAMGTFTDVEATRRKIELEIFDMIKARPDLSYPLIAEIFGTYTDRVAQIGKKFGVRRQVGRKRKDRKAA
jgi:hypothetical protein